MNERNYDAGAAPGRGVQDMRRTEHYFRMQKKYDNTSYYNRDNGYLYIFDEDQREAIGGYDAAIVFWTKNQLSTEEVMERIKQEPPVE